MSNRTTFYPIVTYRDPAKAIAWLCRAFGFKEQMMVKGADGSYQHVELALDSGIVMLGGVKPEMAMQSPQNDPAAAVSVYVAVDDADAHHDRAKAAGAEITMGLRNTDYGSRDYAARDYEGHRWYFGTYRPEPK